MDKSNSRVSVALATALAPTARGTTYMVSVEFLPDGRHEGNR